MKYIDLTHPFTAAMPVYPGDALPELLQIDTIEQSGFSHYQIKTGMHVGTHMDAPAHVVSGGKLLHEFEIVRFVGKGILVDARGEFVVTPKHLTGLHIQPGDIVFVLTGWDKKFTEKEYYQTYPALSEEFAKEMVRLGVSIVGTDTPSPDHSPFLVHKILLGNEILIIENLANLELLLGQAGFEVYALPTKFQAEAAPCRVIAKLT